MFAFFSWWYGHGWQQVAGSFKSRLQAVADSFSVGQLTKTLFAPWRRITTPPGRSLEDKLRAWADNMFSRIIGFFVRLFVLLIAAVAALLIALLTILETLAWPLVPLALPGLIIAGFVI